MEDIDDLVDGTTAHERKAQAEDRIRHWTRKRDEARPSKNRVEAEDCELKIRFWSMRLRGWRNE